MRTPGGVALAVVAALAGCSSRPYSPDDWSGCGAVALGDFDTDTPSWLDGATLREAETALLTALGQRSALSTVRACEQMPGLRVYTKAAPCWRDSFGRDVCGLALCGPRFVLVGTPPHDAGWRRSTLAHELAHVVQGCEATMPVDPGMDAMHADWARHGLNAALLAVQEGQ
jgi:hypothetical protein